MKFEEFVSGSYKQQHVGCGEVRTASIHIGLKSDAVRLAHRHPTVKPDSGILQTLSAKLVLA